MRFSVFETPLQGLVRIERKKIADERGFLDRLFCADELGDLFANGVSQVNRSMSNSQGTVRGLHFQYPPYSEKKLVSCTRGEVFDIAVDIRQGSPTFLQWHAEILSDENCSSLLIPEGFAHGFQTLTDNCELLYLHSCAYQPDAEGALNILDPMLAIKLPLEVSCLSDKDRQHAMISPDYKGINS
jgi:dTDP-4-dehydrorhamnose 3,5-epimerase